jgi:filamentous hemagglutinin family protein
MKLHRHRCWIAGGIAVCCLVTANPIWAQQMAADGTLSTSVTSPDGRNFIIKDGNRVGGNLFHSFSKFSVPTGGSAFFDNGLDVENIISRVTGGEVSKIDGLIRANYGANLFLLNPNGMIFGPNASLNIGGSFIGSSANSINFADGTSFSATNPQATPLLTVSVPVGLQFGSNPGAIQVQGTGHNLRADSPFSPTIRGRNLTGLQVSPGKTLALVGGDVVLEGGTLTAEQGRIELGSVGDGLVSLVGAGLPESSATHPNVGEPAPTTSGWTLGYSGVQSFHDIRLSQQASADASGIGGGSIQVQGRRVSVRDGSTILIQNQGFQPAGQLNLNASESLELSGTSPDGRIPSRLVNENLGLGNRGDIAVSTKQLVIQGGGQIGTKTFSAATGGNITVDASESLQLIGSLVNPTTLTGIGAATQTSGRAGDITVSTGRLAVLDGATVTSLTLGTGSGGNVIVNATESVEVIGVMPIIFQPSALAAITFNAGNAGRLRINTSRLAVRDGGRVDASTFFSGAAGSVTINAKKSVEVSGTVPGSRNPSLVTSSATIQDEAFQQAAGLPPVPSGASGDVTIKTLALSVTDGGLINVKNDGSGNAGTVRVNASSIVLENLGGITAATASGVGGNIFLQAQNLLALGGSAITATALDREGNGGNGGNGGNITIDTDTLVALENSDITANATASFGGRVSINAQGIFGTEFRSQLTPESDITASSSLGAEFSGMVEIQTPDVDTSFGLVLLPHQVIDASEQITAGCAADKGNEFTIVGRGGLPPNPGGILSSETVLADLGTATVQSGSNDFGSAISTNPTSPSPTQIVEAQGWVVNLNGQVVLTANAPLVTPHIPWLTAATCDRG